MALKKRTRVLLSILLFVGAPIALVVWWFKFRLVDKWGNKFALGTTQNPYGFPVLINDSGANAGSLVKLQKFMDGTVGGINANGDSFYWNNKNWVQK